MNIEEYSRKIIKIYHKFTLIRVRLEMTQPILKEIYDAGKEAGKKEAEDKYKEKSWMYDCLNK